MPKIGGGTNDSVEALDGVVDLGEQRAGGSLESFVSSEGVDVADGTVSRMVGL